MINLARVKEADVHIQAELHLANIHLIRNKVSEGEVPYTIEGKLGYWDFSRAWYYWIASAPEGLGLPLETATKLHEKSYPIVGEREPKNYGEVVRVTGHCGCPHPRDWAFPTREVMESESKRIGKNLMRTYYGELAKLCNSGIIKGERFVNSYHIDSQEGLNEFARVIRSLEI